jgi:hypothetical protein
MSEIRKRKQEKPKKIVVDKDEKSKVKPATNSGGTSWYSNSNTFAI